MESPNVSRFNSQSTGNFTLVGSDGRMSPGPSPYSPIFYGGQDDKHWVFLDNLSPKLLRELRRRYDPEHKDDIRIRGTGKIKAWARLGKLGIELRLRRKVSINRDEVTDITLTPDHAKPPLSTPTPMEPWVPELPAEREISELPDNPVSVPSPELPANPERRDSRSASSVISSSDTLPEYQRFDNVSGSGLSGATLAAEVPQTSPIRSEVGQTGIESPHTTTATNTSSVTPDKDIPERPSPTDRNDMAAVQEGLPRTKQRLEDQQRLSESFQAMLEILQRKSTETQTAVLEEESSLDAKKILQNFTVSKPAVYETETDVEPASPSGSLKSLPTRNPKTHRESKLRQRESERPRQKSSPVQPHMTRSRHRIMSSVLNNSNEVQFDPEHAQDRLVRRRTIPGKTPANADVEDLWRTLLLSAATLLGPEHPLLYQAKTDLARSRANHHKGDNLLGTLWECRLIAENLLGAHPSVSQFVTDLETLTEMMGQDVLAANLAMTQKQPESIATPTSSSSASTPATPRPAAPDAAKPMEEQNSSQQNQVSDMLSPASTVHSNSPVRPELALDTNVPCITIQEAEPSLEKGVPQHLMYNTTQPPHKPRSNLSNFGSLVVSSLVDNTSQGLAWAQKKYGPEPRVEPGKVRVRWTCSCGEALHDDFIETRPGAARELEAYLNRPRTHTGADSPASPNSSTASKSFTSSSLSGLPSSQTSWSSYGMSNGQSPNSAHLKHPRLDTGSFPVFTPYHAPDPPWLLTCADEDRYTPKLSHLDMSRQKVRSDKDLALALREHYYSVNKKWYRTFRLRGLSSIEFVQFEVHQNRFCDLRKVPDVPPPSRVDDYDFTPGDLLPPVGSTYLLHLFRHPQDYDGELITYLRSPKKSTGRLSLGVGWGINLVEGFDATKVWTLIALLFILASTVFGVVWACSKQDVQGAFGVAAWILALAIMIIGWAQASFG